LQLIEKINLCLWEMDILEKLFFFCAVGTESIILNEHTLWSGVLNLLFKFLINSDGHGTDIVLMVINHQITQSINQ
jgi:hypothetical protein